MNKIKEQSFITRPAFWSIEINAHTVLYIVLLVIDGKLPIEALNTYLFTSQPCENMFRIARSLSGPYSSVTNFSVKSFLKRCEKITIINSLKTPEAQNEKYRLHFPQHHKSEKNAHGYATPVAGQQSLTYDDLERIIGDAFASAKNYVELVKMEATLIRKNLYSLSDLSRYVKVRLSKSSSTLVDHIRDDGTVIEDYDSDATNDTDDDNEENDDEDSIYDSAGEISNNYEDENIDDENKEIEDEPCNLLADDSINLGQNNFKGCRIYDKVSSKGASSFFRVRIGSSIKYIHKQTACWLLTSEKTRLSADRLMRVQQSEK